MASTAHQPDQSRYLERKVEQGGLRPRFAASVIAGIWLAAIVVFGILQHLLDPESFDNIWLGMWWATQTVTTVGYGDVVPMEVPGQLLAVILMVGGLSLFAVVTGTITSAFVMRAQDKIKSEKGDPVEARMDLMAAELKALREQLIESSDAGGKPHPRE